MSPNEEDLKCPSKPWLIMTGSEGMLPVDCSSLVSPGMWGMAKNSQELSGKDNWRASCATSTWMPHRNLLVNFLERQLSLQSSLVRKVAGWLWLDSLAQHRASLTPDCHQTASDMPLGKTDNCSLLKYSSYNVRPRHTMGAVLTTAPHFYRTEFTEKLRFPVCPVQALHVV